MLKLYHRRVAVWYLFFFLLSSSLYIYIVQSLVQGVSCFQFEFFLQYIKTYQFLLWPMVLVSIMVFYVMKSSFIFVWAYFLLVTTLSMSSLFEDFNKFILVMNTCYFCIGFFFSFFWQLELKEVIYNPLFSLYDLELVPRLTIPVKLTFVQNQNEVYEGLLSNWSQDQCFIIFKETLPAKISTQIIVEIHYLQNRFLHQGKVYTSFMGKKALGIQLNYPKKNIDDKNWFGLYEILEQQGMLPSTLY